MNYVVSDIHGCYEKYKELLKTIDLGEEDVLYVLGDVIDRGSEGFQILLDMAQQPNIVCLMGNHEAMAIDVISEILISGEQGRKLNFSKAAMGALSRWFYNGGEVSLMDFLALNEEQMQTVWEYMKKLPLYKEITVGDKQFVLVHGGLEKFSLTKPLESYKANEILWYRPTLETEYYSDKCTIFGHTPVQLLTNSNETDTDTPAKIYHNKNWIAIDCGCVFSGGKLGCLCLDTMEEFYV